MMQSRLMTILRAPIISEKANNVHEKYQCMTFKVLPNATKLEIKKAVEEIFGVKVKAVRTLNVQGKKRRSAHGFGVRSDWKKAYVTLAEGETIDIDSQADGKESN